MSQISENLQIIQNHIEKICENSKRNVADVQLVAVSKKQPDDRIDEALDAGHRVYGENRVQEAQGRWESRRRDYADLKLHLIGPLQTNKTKDAVALFDVIEVLDREKLARALKKEMDKQERHLPCLIQINIGEEDQKSGIIPADFDSFYEFCTQDCGLNIQGLMCIPPFDDAPAPHFALLKKMADGKGLKTLSMGMSADYDTALALGATHIRVGTGVFGSRPKPA